MASKTAPTILLITGAFTTTQCYDRMTALLKQAGYPVAVAGPASCNSTEIHRHSAESDGRYLLDQNLLPLIKDGNDVVVFAHSFGATCLSGADRKLSKNVRSSQGLQGGVLGLVYISFAFAKDGVSQSQYLGGTWPPFCSLDNPSKGLFTFHPAIEHLFNDVGAATAAELVKTHLPHPVQPFETPVSQPLWTDPDLTGRRVMIKTLQDATFPPGAQQMFADGSGVDWEILEVDGGHEAVVTRAAAVVDVVASVIEKWTS